MPSTAETRSDDAPRRVVDGRARERTAPARCVGFAAWSELMSSPHDRDARPALRERQGVGESLPYANGLDDIIGAYCDADFAALKREYSGLFEVGSDGPPVPIREDLQTGMRGGTREGIVRFYNFFGYALADDYAWAPDHLSVELEFLHFLSYREAAADSDEAATSYQLAQLDFCDRHLCRWMPQLVAGVAEQTSAALFATIVRGLDAYLAADLEWQRSTITTSADGQ